MAFFVTTEKLGPLATPTQARRMVELLRERGIHAVMTISGVNKLNDPAECAAAEKVWNECLALLRQESRHMTIYVVCAINLRDGDYHMQVRTSESAAKNLLSFWQEEEVIFSDDGEAETPWYFFIETHKVHL